MDLKHKLGKLTSVLLIGSGVYQIIYSTVLLIFVYPRLKFGTGYSGKLLYESLIEKALVYYVLMIINGIYGFSLLFKPKEKLTYLQIIGGLIIFCLTTFFVTQSSITVDPIFNFLMKLIGR